jgi:hypothetical protein
MRYICVPVLDTSLTISKSKNGADRIRIFYDLYIYTSNHGQSCLVFSWLFLFIPGTNLDDTKTIFDYQVTNLVMVSICS